MPPHDPSYENSSQRGAETEQRDDQHFAGKEDLKRLSENLNARHNQSPYPPDTHSR